MELRLTFGSLFSGIGGFDLGFERAGMVCRWQVEIDEFCTRVLEKHWPHVERHRDIHEVGAHNLAAVDVVCGGPPCQPHSLAGLRRGADDDRNLWPQMCRVVEQVNPRWVVVENVPGISSTILDAICADLEARGYEVGAIDLPAAGAGAPHIRQRIFILAHAHGRGGAVGNNFQEGNCERLGTIFGDDGAPVSDAHGVRCGQRADQPQRVAGGGRASHAGPAVQAEVGEWWRAEPDVVRVVPGFPQRVDRSRRPRVTALGNAVVPQVAEIIGRLIVATDEHFRIES